MFTITKGTVDSIQEAICKPGDAKPTVGVSNGAFCYQMAVTEGGEKQNAKVFCFDADTKTWEEQ